MSAQDVALAIIGVCLLGVGYLLGAWRAMEYTRRKIITARNGATRVGVDTEALDTFQYLWEENK